MKTKETTKLQTYAIAYELGVAYKDISSTIVDAENDTIIVHYLARYYNSPIKLKKVLSYSDINDIATIHGRSLLIGV